MHRKRYLVEKTMAAGSAVGGGPRGSFVFGRNLGRDLRLRGSGHEHRLGTDARLLTKLYAVRAVLRGAEASVSSERSARGHLSSPTSPR